MSDGNFNRNLLPSHSFQSGVRTGRAVMKTKALAAFSKWLVNQSYSLTDKQIREAKSEFRRYLED
nr:hypothetical protein [uncultured Alloprevotella sp.]